MANSLGEFIVQKQIVGIQGFLWQVFINDMKKSYNRYQRYMELYINIKNLMRNVLQKRYRIFSVIGMCGKLDMLENKIKINNIFVKTNNI